MEKKNTTRREFISNSAKASIALTILPVVSSAFTLGDGNQFAQQPLLYTYKDLEPVIDAMTMEIHYSKHAATYLKNLNEAVIAEKATSKKLEDLLANISKYTPKMRNNAGGHYNHELFWQCLTNKPASMPTGKLLAAIVKNFGSLEAFKKQFEEAAKTRFGSGWAWLIVTADKKLQITSTANQDNNMMDVAEIKGTPVLALDVWEHAYYLKYQNKRADYIANWWTIVNWKFVEQRFENMQ
jgi:superoxide dismutase, Fe-Mn family